MNTDQQATNNNEFQSKAFFATYKKIFKENLFKGFLQGVGIMLGIGTTSLAFKLDVAGDINATGCVKGSAGTVTGGGTCMSDQRLKKDISYYAHSLEKITQLKPASFGWKKEKYDWLKPYADKDNGLIAQDVEKVFPHLVKTDEKGFKTVSYSIEMEMHLIQSIKELKSLHNATVAEKLSTDKRVLSLEKENLKLREELTTIKRNNENRLTQLEEQIKELEKGKVARR